MHEPPEPALQPAGTLTSSRSAGHGLTASVCLVLAGLPGLLGVLLAAHMPCGRAAVAGHLAATWFAVSLRCRLAGQSWNVSGSACISAPVSGTLLLLRARGSRLLADAALLMAAAAFSVLTASLSEAFAAAAQRNGAHAPPVLSALTAAAALHAIAFAAGAAPRTRERSGRRRGE